MRSFRLSRSVAVLAAASLAACASSRSVTVGSPTPGGVMTNGAYVVTLGRDTLAVEQFRRTPTRLTGDLVQRAPSTLVSHYDLTLGADGMPVRLDYFTRRPDGTPVPGRAKSAALLFQADTVVTQLQMPNDSMVTRKAAMKHVWPYVANSYAFLEPVLAMLRASGRDSVDAQWESIGAPEAFAMPVKLFGADSARVWYFGSPKLARVDGTGAILGLDGRLTTDKIVVHRVSSLDIPALAKRFAAEDAAGKGLGSAPSPRDTVTASIAGADVWVDYGRPALRGRDVWANNSVLGDTLWRTGANAATQFRTSKDLVIAGQAVPAGMYTLWTHVMPGGRYELVVNKQVGQWGTDYDHAQDLVRVPLSVTQLPTPAERFTIGVAPQGNGGVLTLVWGERQLSVPFTVR